MASETTQSDLTIWNIDFSDLAKQICLKDFELFKAITIEEINSFNWSKNRTKALCPNLMISNKQFNKINLWVQKEILDQKISVVGTKVISKFINLSKRLLQHKNFQSAYAVKSALHSTSIYRLEYLWSEISRKDKSTWDKLMSVFNVEDNYKNLRKSMGDAKKPCIPFLGIYLCDLTGLDAAHPIIDGVESENRKTAFNNIYNSIRLFQKSNYEFKINPGIQNYLLSKEYMEEFQNYIIDTLFDLSKALEQDSNGLKSPQVTSQVSTINTPASPFNKTSKFQPRHRKCESNGSNERYRKISDNEREAMFFSNPDMSNMGSSVERESTALKISKIRNLLDQTVLEEKQKTVSENDNQEISYPSGSPQHHSPTIKISQYYTNDDNINAEIESYHKISYVEPDILTSSIVFKLILEGCLKRKLKIKNTTFCMPPYQKVLVRLYISNLDSFLSFFIGKVNRPRSLSDFKNESPIKIPLNNATLIKKTSFNPKIVIDLPHEVYILKSADEVSEEWPTINQWWKCLNDAKSRVILSKPIVSDPQNDLINLIDDVTRL